LSEQASKTPLKKHFGMEKEILNISSCIKIIDLGTFIMS
jgi:hypothetical protein